MFPVATRHLRGTSQYWRAAKQHGLAMCSTLGPPNMFLTVSSNDAGPEWVDLYRAIDPQRFQTQGDVAALTYAQRVELLNQYSSVAAEQYYRRVKAVLAFITQGRPFGGVHDAMGACIAQCVTHTVAR
jgi:hypothetical protein